MERYTVKVADNFHYRDESETFTYGSFEIYEDAVKACRAIVDLCLADLYQPGMTAEKLSSLYTMFGDDPFVVPADPTNRFSAWEYAKERTAAICRKDAGLPPQAGE